jgi:cell division protein YceG involved in septum cleavage
VLRLTVLDFDSERDNKASQRRNESMAKARSKLVSTQTIEPGREALRNWSNEPVPTRDKISKLEWARSAKPEIQTLVDKGYTLSQIADRLKAEGVVDSSVSMLKNAMRSSVTKSDKMEDKIVSKYGDNTNPDLELSITTMAGAPQATNSVTRRSRFPIRPDTQDL